MFPFRKMPPNKSIGRYTDLLCEALRSHDRDLATSVSRAGSPVEFQNLDR